MTSGQPSGGPSAAKVGGFALIGAGVLAAVFGVATLVSGDPGAAAQRPGGTGTAPTTSVVTNPPTGSEAGSEPGTPTSTDRRTPAPSPTAPGTPASKPPPSRGAPGAGSSGGEGSGPAGGGRTGEDPAAGGRPGGGQAVPAPGGPGRPGDSRQIVLRVYNNSNIRGLAHRAAEDFRTAGYRVAEIGNYSDGRIPVTTIYYRPGTPEEAQARIVGDRFGARVEPRFPGIRDASPGVIAIVTRSYDGPEQGK